MIDTATMRIQVRNKVKKFLVHPAGQGILVAFILTLFLLPSGVWIYHDNIFLAKSAQEAAMQFRRIFSTLDITDYYSTFWGYDSTYFNVGRILAYPIFLLVTMLTNNAGIGQYVFFLLFFFVSYVTLYTFFGLFSKNALGKTLGTLFVITTQYFLFCYTILGFAYCILGVPLFVVSFVKLYEKRIRFIHLFLLAVSAYWIMSYQRLFLIYVSVIAVIFLLMFKKIVSMWKRTLVILGTLVLTSLPIFLSLFATFQDGNGSGSANNYQNYFKLANGANSYAAQTQRSLFRAFNYYGNGLSFLDLHNETVVLMLSIFATVIGFFVLWCLVKKRKKLIAALLLVFYLVALFLSSLAHFVSQEKFIKITYDYLPFLANESNHIKILSLLVTGIVIPIVLSMVKKRWVQGIFVVSVVGYIVLSSLPLFTPNKEKAQLAYSEIPQEYRDFFFGKEEFNSYIYYPNSVDALKDPYGLPFNWYETPVEFNQSLRYKMLGTSNVRLVSLKQAKLFNEILKHPTSENLKYFGLNNVLLYKDLQNPKKNEFVYFNNQRDYKKESEKKYLSFKQSDNLFPVYDSKRFARFQPTNKKNFDYLVYSPNTVVQKDVETVVDGDEDFSAKKPLILDKYPTNIPQIDLAPFATGNANVHVDAKQAIKDRGVVYVKVSNISEGKQFLLHLNQTFSPQWRVAVISQKTYENVNCENATVYEDTQNSLCFYQGHVMDPQSLKIFFAKQEEGKHFEGNIIGNTWLLNPENLNPRSNGDIYIALYYKRQMWYHASLIASGLGMLGLLGVAVWQEIEMRRKKVIMDATYERSLVQGIQSQLSDVQ